MSGQAATPLDLFALILTRFAPRGTPRVDESTSLVASGWLDSFGIVELVAILERELGVLLRDEDVVPANFETVGRIRELLARAARP